MADPKEIGTLFDEVDNAIRSQQGHDPLSALSIKLSKA
jgi:hypothetical protein